MEQNENARERPSEAVQDEILASILQRLGGSGGSPDTGGSFGTGVATSAGGVKSGGTNPLGDIFSSVLSNPELLSKLPTIISSVKPIIEMFGKGFYAAAATSAEASSNAVATSADATASTAVAKVKDIPVSAKSSDSRTALLCAMKPYLSDERRNAVDYIVKISRLGEILKTL